ncbi:substrate-binding domain-containing protein [Pseudonocardia nigra]|uniref:substrate-binding domain-containing protein n=1 Tax=Pseudonocardia nigra TaxID=1921578 RepID=UPI001C5FFFCE|nr:substrate-binding domain-containing protein [Pseudonocardia nigra]
MPELEPRTQRRKAASQTSLDIALVIPRAGPAGIFGPSCELCAQLAVEELNAEGGVLGREARLVLVDGSRPPDQVAAELDGLVRSRTVEAVVGWHLSALRQVLGPRLAARVPYVYTPLYEGGERARGVYLAGETPAVQLAPSLLWLSRELGLRRWAVVGNDYVWPRVSAAAARSYLRSSGAQLMEEVFVPLGTANFDAVLGRLERSDCEGVLLLLVGQDAVEFNRQFAAAGLDRMTRLSPLMEENMLLATGAENTRGLWAAAGYFECLPTAASLDFNARFVRRFGLEAPALNSIGQSCYQGMSLLADLARRAGCLDVPALDAVAPSVSFEGARGRVRMRGRHLQQDIYLARADGLEFDVVCTL